MGRAGAELNRYDPAAARVTPAGPLSDRGRRREPVRGKVAGIRLQLPSSDGDRRFMHAALCPWERYGEPLVIGPQGAPDFMMHGCSD